MLAAARSIARRSAGVERVERGAPLARAAPRARSSSAPSNSRAIATSAASPSRAHAGDDGRGAGADGVAAGVVADALEQRAAVGGAEAVDAAAEAEREAVGAGARAGVGGERDAGLGGRGAQVVGHGGGDELAARRLGRAGLGRAGRPAGRDFGGRGRVGLRLTASASRCG